MTNARGAADHLLASLPDVQWMQRPQELERYAVEGLTPGLVAVPSLYQGLVALYALLYLPDDSLVLCRYPCISSWIHTYLLPLWAFPI